MDNEYINPRVAASRLGVHRVSFYKFVRQGRIPGVVRLGPRCVRIHAKRFQEFLDAGGLQIKK